MDPETIDYLKEKLHDIKENMQILEFDIRKLEEKEEEEGLFKPMEGDYMVDLGEGIIYREHVTVLTNEVNNFARFNTEEQVIAAANDVKIELLFHQLSAKYPLTPEGDRARACFDHYNGKWLCKSFHSIYKNSGVFMQRDIKEVIKILNESKLTPTTFNPIGE